MSNTDAAVENLKEVSQELERRGQVDLSKRIEEVITTLRNGAVPEPPGGVITTGEAAKLLGIRSINTIKRWAGDGLLEGFRRGGRILVSRKSVEQMLASPALARQREWEQGVAEVLEPFDAGDHPIPSTGAAHIGRKPWSYVGSPRS